MDTCPEKLNELLSPKERAPLGKCPLMTFFFGGNPQVMQDAKNLLELRLNETEDQQLSQQAESQQRIATLGSQKIVKASTVSSKMLPPPPPKTTSASPAPSKSASPAPGANSGPVAVTPKKNTKGGKAVAHVADAAGFVSPTSTKSAKPVEILSQIPEHGEFA